MCSMYLILERIKLYKPHKNNKNTLYICKIKSNIKTKHGFGSRFWFLFAWTQFSTHCDHHRHHHAHCGNDLHWTRALPAIHRGVVASGNTKMSGLLYHRCFRKLRCSRSNTVPMRIQRHPGWNIVSLRHFQNYLDQRIIK